MKKVILPALAALAIVGGASAQSKFDGPAAQLVSDAHNQAVSLVAGYRALPSAVTVDQSVTVIVTMTDTEVLTDIENLGCDVIDARGNMALVAMTPEQMQMAAKFDGVKNISLGYEAQPLLNTARAVTHVDDVVAGTGLDRGYDGTGVIVGMMDTGFDPNHVNFLNEDGSSRISHMWVITGSNSALREYSGAELAKYTTDNSGTTHGTHVMGIMAGGYKGIADQVAITNNRGNNTVKRNYNVPYYGVATGAEMAPAIGSLQGNNILNAAAKVLEYAKEQGKPAVLNLSLGHNYGPHDGKTAAGQYLAEVGKEILVCVAAGNEGDTNLSLTKTFKEGDTELRTTLSETAAANGGVDMWSRDDQPFDFSFVGVNKNDGSIAYRYDFEGTKPGTYYLTGTGFMYPGYITDSKLNNVFSSKAAVVLTISTSELNNRFNVYVTSVQTYKSTATDVVPGFIIKGKAGQTVDMYCVGGLQFFDNGISGYSKGSTGCTINDMACADNILAVGAYTNISEWPTLGGKIGYGTEGGAVAEFSSYGSRTDGTQLPHILAPGECVVSSYSNYYMAAGSDPYDGRYTVARKDEEKRSHYWAEMSGTSMASPFMAGVLALWLQADPDLTMDRVKQILKETATNDDYTLAEPLRSGYGKVDALAGLKKVLAGSAVNEVKAESTVMVNQTAPGCFDIFVPGADTVEARLYSMAGSLAAEAVVSGENAALTADGVPAGIYVLTVKAGTVADTRKVVVR